MFRKKIRSHFLWTRFPGQFSWKPVPTNKEQEVPQKDAQYMYVLQFQQSPKIPIPVIFIVCVDFFYQLLIFCLFSHRNFKEIQQRKSNPKNCITSKARGLLQDVMQMAFIFQVGILFCKISLLKNMLSGTRGSQTVLSLEHWNFIAVLR